MSTSVLSVLSEDIDSTSGSTNSKTRMLNNYIILCLSKFVFYNVVKFNVHGSLIWHQSHHLQHFAAAVFVSIKFTFNLWFIFHFQLLFCLMRCQGQLNRLHFGIIWPRSTSNELEVKKTNTLMSWTPSVFIDTSHIVPQRTTPSMHVMGAYVILQQVVENSSRVVVVFLLSFDWSRRPRRRASLRALTTAPA